MTDRADPERILVVEDDELVLTIVKSVLMQSGYVVAVARDGQEGLEVARTFDPELIICDISMPIMGGLRLCEEIRKDSSSVIPFIFMTAFAENVEQTRSICRDGDEILLKPIKPDTLTSVVSAILA